MLNYEFLFIKNILLNASAINNDRNNETKISNKFFIMFFLLSLKPINN